ncbi:hypothetical protein MRX96_001100 [Rhipicephalus microplus]
MAVQQQHLQQPTMRPDVIVLQETFTEEVKFPGYKASASPPSLRDTTGSTSKYGGNEMRRCLDAKYLPPTLEKPHTDYEGVVNSSLDRDTETWRFFIKRAVVFINRKLTVRTA